MRGITANETTDWLTMQQSVYGEHDHRNGLLLACRAVLKESNTPGQSTELLADVLASDSVGFSGQTERGHPDCCSLSRCRSLGTRTLARRHPVGARPLWSTTGLPWAGPQASLLESSPALPLHPGALFRTRYLRKSRDTPQK